MATTAAVLVSRCATGCSATVAGRAHTGPRPVVTGEGDGVGVAGRGGHPDPSASGTGLVLPPIGITLRRILVDPDPGSRGPLTGTITLARLTREKALAVADIDCLRDNGLRVGFARQSGGEPAMTTWALELGSGPGARNCAEQMRRTDQAAGTFTDLSATYRLPGVTVYRVVDGGATGGVLVVFRGVYTAGTRLFRVTVSGRDARSAAIEDRFRTLLDRQLGVAPAGPAHRTGRPNGPAQPSD